MLDMADYGLIKAYRRQGKRKGIDNKVRDPSWSARPGRISLLLRRKLLFSPLSLCWPEGVG